MDRSVLIGRTYNTYNYNFNILMLINYLDATYNVYDLCAFIDMRSAMM